MEERGGVWVRPIDVIPRGVRPEYDWDRIAVQWSDLFEEVLATHPYCRAAA